MIVAVLFMLIGGRPMVIDNIASAQECESMRHQIQAEMKDWRVTFYAKCFIVEKK